VQGTATSPPSTVLLDPSARGRSGELTTGRASSVRLRAVMKNSKFSPPRLGLGLATLATAALIAGCGSSGSSSESKIVPGAENEKANSVTETVAKAPSTPTTGPLSKEPTVKPPGGPAPTKLEIKDLVKGTGAVAKAGATVSVNYVGVLFTTGAVFDASWKRHEPFSFTLGQGQVIPGWDQGVAGMKVGGRRELIIPAALAYGKTARPGIPANSPLVFVVDLLSA
jgi:peptidylprolyl isomerase